LIDLGFVTNSQVESVRDKADSSGEGLVDTLVAESLLRPADVAHAKAAHFGTEYVSLRDYKLTDDVINSVPRHIAKKYRVVPLSASEDSVALAGSDPSDLDTIDSLQHLLNRQIELKVATDEDIDDAISRYYGERDDGVGKMIQDITEGEVMINTLGDVGSVDDGDAIDADAPIIKLANQLIIDAFKLEASDIHLEPLEKDFRVRYRVDGVLQLVKGPPKRLQGPIIARLKIMAGMSIAERRIPQDGRIQVNVGSKFIDLRVSCLPTNHGESIVMRILDKEGLKLGLAELGFFADDQQKFEELIALPDGILLVTGPTGSGKTTTLYSCLHYINRPDRKIITVEDPVEYQLPGVNQVQVHEKIGFTFAQALRAMLRQSPNVIMLGEIRDMETATIAINASLTGHLVFSTLHTNDAPGAVTRLIDIGVKPFLVASAARCLMAQRLVRKVCQKCSEPYTASPSELQSVGIDPGSVADANIRKGAGCATCNNTGHKGRFGIFEIFTIDDEARKLIYDCVPTSVLRTKAREMGMRTLREDGARKVLAGMTSFEAVLKATAADFD
jgi:general secretion pathway protein E/type IV pilus assembly protein PilB